MTIGMENVGVYAIHHGQNKKMSKVCIMDGIGASYTGVNWWVVNVNGTKLKLCKFHKGYLIVVRFSKSKCWKELLIYLLLQIGSDISINISTYIQYILTREKYNYNYTR